MSQTIQTPRNLAPPSFLKQMREFALPVDLLKYSLHYPRLITAPRGDGRSVFLLPGYGAGEMSMLPLSAFLGTLGYDVHPWGLGRNRGGVERMVARFARNIEDHIHRHQNGPVTLIGWSLGGVVAREVAREYPDTVREVITMGTPIIGGPKYTAVGARYARNDRIDLDAIEAEAHRRNLRGLLQPLTVIYSPEDGIVGPEIARDAYNRHARNIEVSGTHIGLGINPMVWRIIAETLADSTKE
jgi:fermentation-respiration switch protein FrsA (DUF1100 family)